MRVFSINSHFESFLYYLIDFFGFGLSIVYLVKMERCGLIVVESLQAAILFALGLTNLLLFLNDVIRGLVFRFYPLRAVFLISLMLDVRFQSLLLVLNRNF